MSQRETVQALFEDCETAERREAFQDPGHVNATCFGHAGALADATKLAGYTAQKKGLFGQGSGGQNVLKSFETDEARVAAVMAAEFHGTVAGKGETTALTGESIVADCAYVLEIDGLKIRQIPKVLNSLRTLRRMGWA